jgi:uroporphyrinogen decarboxylase
MIAGRAAASRARRGGWRTAIPTFRAIIERIEALTFDYLSGRSSAARSVQLFDSWAGSLRRRQFERWVIAPTARLVAR